MKRIVSILLAVCLMTGAAPLACAEDAALRVLDGWGAADAYLEAYPGRAIQTIDLFNQNGDSLLCSILTGGEWDAVCFETDRFPLAELNRLGLVYDLNASAEASAVGARLYPSILAGCSVSGKLAALPAGFVGTRAVSYRLLGMDHRGEEDGEGLALRNQLGFMADDQPTTFADVCALGLRYMALSREQRKGTAFLFSDTAPAGFSLLYNMILTYQTEATDENGRIDFDTAAFRAALTAADPLLAAFGEDPKRTYDENGNLSMVLCDGIGVMQSYGAFASVTQEGVIPAFMTVVVVNPNSPRLEEAIDYALLANSRNETEFAPAWYADVDYDALLAQSYDESIAAQREQGEDPSVIDRLEAMKAAGNDTYFMPKRMMEHYAAEIMPRLVFRRWDSFAIDDAIFAYLDGRTDADGFVEALNESAAS